MINEAVRKGQEVKSGQVVMEPDAQINSTSGNMRTSLFKVNDDEQQSFRQIDSQRGTDDAVQC